MDDPAPDPRGPTPEPEEEASEEALATAEAFFVAVQQHDARAIWDLFTERAKAYVVNLGQDRGMDIDLASRLRRGTASDEELDTFLEDLLAGIQKDLQDIDLTRVALESKAIPESPFQVRVTYLVQVGVEQEGLQAAIPAGSLVLSHEEQEGWKVERLVPRPGDEPPQAGDADGLDDRG